MTACRCFISMLALLGILAGGAAPLVARQPSTGGNNAFPVPTMGGKQLWADELFFYRWRIQRNVLTGHCRLLDENNLRYGWGTFDQCKAKLEQIKRARAMPPMRGKVVVVLHGLFRSRTSMSKLCEHLGEQGGYTVLNVGYASTQREVGSHAKALERIVDNLDGVDEISFIGHSMGNIVIRHYLADREQNKRPPGKAPPRFHRFVMLAPPNHGSLVALTLAETDAFKVLTGRSGRQLGAEWAELEDKLATPGFEFGIVAGGKGDALGFNPLLPGDDDGTVSVASTRLAGAGDFVVVPVLHSFVMNDPDVLDYTLRFLQKGYFVAADRRQPIKETKN